MHARRFQILLLTIFELACLLWRSDVANADAPANFSETLLAREGYDPSSRPGSQTIVYLDFFINSISSISEVDMDYTLSIFMRQSWLDPRLAFSEFNETLTLSFEQISRLWVPDLFIKNEKKGTFHDITVPNRLITLTPEGMVGYSQRLSLTLGCELYLASYPMDTQSCSVDIESYGYTTKELIFKWKEIEKPVQVKENLQLPEFILDETHIELADCTTGYVTGAFSCKTARLPFRRQFNYYLIQFYIPTTLIVILSWVSFWIDLHAVPARITLGLLTVLTMTAQSSGSSSRLPRVSYVKAIDIWTTACLAFVFGALIEYSIVNVLARKRQNRLETAKRKEVTANVTKLTGNLKKATNDHDTANLEEIEMSFSTANDNGHLRQRTTSENTDIQHDNNSECSEANNQCLIRRVAKNRALFVDVISRGLFPLVFLVFNVVYWLVYLPW